MKISITSFTEQGNALAGRIKDVILNQEAEIFYHPEQGLSLWTKEQFDKKNAMIFIGACGIAVRAIAPYVKDKLTDPPVLVLDEEGRFVIPVLSGHMGGANELAETLANKLKATAVITTATDIHGKLAIDLFAKKNDLQILNKDGIAKVSAKVLRGERIVFAIEDGMIKDMDERPEYIDLVSCSDMKNVDVLITSDADQDIWKDKATLRLKPREYVIGIGCKKGKATEEIETFVSENLQRIGVKDSDIIAVASIENKKKEAGICQFAKKREVPFLTFSKERLLTIEGNFSKSAFVKETVGVDNVCERAAMAVCMGEGKLVLRKQTGNGMTVAVAKKNRKIKWEW